MRRSVPGAVVMLAFATATTAEAQQGAPNVRQLPDISVVGDMIADLSPKGSTQPDGARFSLREVELALQAAVDPYFRGDVFLGFSDEGVHVEQAYLTATALPYGLEARLGRFFMPVGKQNTTHRHDLHSIEHSYVVQDFLGAEGLKGTGVWVSRVFAPLGFYQELQLTAVDRLGDDHAHEHEEGEEAEEEPEPDAPANRRLDGLGYAARLRNYFDLSEASNLEVSFSGATGKRAQHLHDGADGEYALNLRQSVIGADVTFRWRPLQQGLYRSFILQGEVMRQLNEEVETLFGEPANRTGAYVFGRYQLTRRLHLGARGDWLEDGEAIAEALDDTALKAGSAYLEFFPSEFSKLVAGYERLMPASGENMNRILLQATFALGPHKPHPF